MNTKKLLSHTFTGILVLCALFITFLIIQREFIFSDSNSNERKVNNWRELELPGNLQNVSDADVQIIKFFDYQCPYCKQIQLPIDFIQSKYGDKVMIRHVHFPLKTHEYAYEAAIAAECARNQNKFKEYHDLLFDQQDQLGAHSWVGMANKAGIEEIEVFRDCILNDDTESVIEDGLALIKNLGINRIPTLLINETLVVGALSKEKLESYVNKAFANNAKGKDLITN